MTEKMLGKITFAEYGTVRDYPFLIGLQLGFSMQGYAVDSGGKYCVNISPDCRWTGANRNEIITKSVEEVRDILESANVKYVSELINKPIEVIIEDKFFRDFRILTEVL